MILATWNINGINKRLAQLVRFLEDQAPDVLCLQELKCTQSEFPHAELLDVGYNAIWRGEGRWNGVAILARGRQVNLIRDTLPGDRDDDQARYIEAAVDGRIIGCVYAPNGNPYPGPKYDHKLKWLYRLKLHANDLQQYGAPVILAGDFNVVPTASDIYETTSYDDNALVQGASRAALRHLLDCGFADAKTALDACSASYTFWDYRRERWSRNAGLRIDLVLLNQLALGGLRSVDVFREAQEWDNPSDHAPLICAC